MPNDATQATLTAAREWSCVTHEIEVPQGEDGVMHDRMICQRQGCTQRVVTRFRSEAFCLEHFCIRCYQLLESIDQRTVNDPASPVTLEQALLADECAQRAIDVCLGSDRLNNLERARLLDILLWCGDLSSAFRPQVRAVGTASYRAPCEKLQLCRSSVKAAFSD